MTFIIVFVALGWAIGYVLDSYRTNGRYLFAITDPSRRDSILFLGDKKCL
jgi:hypothetical protein